MKIGLVGGSYQERSLPFDAQRSLGLFPVLDPEGKEVSALYGTPGLSLFGTAGTGVGRGIFTAANGRCFAVTGNSLYEMTSSGAETFRGTILSSTGVVSMTENGTQLAICDGTYAYIFTYATNTLVQITDPDFPSSVGTITFIDGYFVVNQNSTGKFYISASYNGLSWGALDFATAESSPDDLKRVINAVGQLWLFGTKTSEIWTNTGDSAFPFQRISGAKMEVGILAPHSAVAIDNSIFWLGRDDNGSGIVFRARGFSPQRVSTSPIERIVQGSSNIEGVRGYSYQEDGHVFYVLTGGGLPTTLVYDVTTGIWHERAYLAATGEYEQHLASDCTFAFSKHLVTDRTNGNIYEMSLNYYSDNGNPIPRERIYTHIADEGKQLRFSALEIGFESGVGLQTGQGNDPVCSMCLSKDGGRTWTSWYDVPIGKAGKTLQKAAFRRLGIAEQFTFKIRITDPIKVAICGSYLK